MKTIEAMPGDHISKVAREACQCAKLCGEPVGFTFNGHAIVAQPDSTPDQLAKQYDEHCEAASRAYWTPERLRAKEAKEQQDRAVLGAHMEQFGTAIAGGLLLPWLATLSDLVFRHTPFDTGGFIARLEAAGYVDNDFVGKTPEWLEKHPEEFGRYLVGQAINCAKHGLPPHQLTQKFVREWCALMTARHPSSVPSR